MPIQTGYLSTNHGFLKILQINFCLSALICAVIVRWAPGMTFCLFVGAFCTVCVTVHVVLIVANVSLLIRAYIIIALVGYLLMSTFSLMAFIGSCVIARKYYRFAGFYDLDQGTLVAVAVFFLLSTIVLVIDLLLQFKGYDVTMTAESSSSTSVTGTAVTTTTV